VWVHEESDKLYCEEIDVGEDEPHNITSGLWPFMDAEDMEGRMVLVLCNLKACKLAGFPSHGMVSCASNEDHTEVKIVGVPVEAKIGEHVTIPVLARSRKRRLGHYTADLRPAFASVDGKEVTSFGRVEAAEGVLLKRGGRIYDGHEKVAFSAGMCASRIFEAQSGAGERRGGEGDKL
jgi:tRNA-binding EMAP/Myf-like protein